MVWRFNVGAPLLRIAFVDTQAALWKHAITAASRSPLGVQNLCKIAGVFIVVICEPADHRDDFPDPLKSLVLARPRAGLLVLVVSAIVFHGGGRPREWTGP